MILNPISLVKKFLLKTKIVKPKFVELWPKNLRTEMESIRRLPKKDRPTWRRIFLLHVSESKYNSAAKKPLMVPPYVIINQKSDEEVREKRKKRKKKKK